MWKDVTTTLADTIKVMLGSRKDNSGGLWGICGVNFINLCTKYSTWYPIAFLCFYLSLFLYTSIWVCNDTLKWRKIPTVQPPRIRKSPRLGKYGKHYRVLIKGDCEHFSVIHHTTIVHKLRPNRGGHITFQLWYEVGKGGILYPIHLNDNTEW